MKTFELLFEQDARWMTGKTLITQMIDSLKTKSPIVIVDERFSNEIMLSISLQSKHLNAIPLELTNIFSGQCSLTKGDWFSGKSNILGKYKNSPLTDDTLAAINNTLHTIERDRKAKNSDKQLWRCFARRMGCQRDTLESIEINITR